MDLKQTILHEEHKKMNAHLLPFAGWDMPIQYSSIIEEHLHTRTKAGLFDICHMGELILKGKGAKGDVERLITCRIDNMSIGKCRYGFLLNEDGKILDDLIAFKTKADEFMLVVNAANTEKDSQWIQKNISKDTIFEDISEKTAKLDLQGPLSKEVLSSLSETDLSQIKKYHFITTKINGIETLISRTGYTGELGYELYFPTQKAPKLWRKLLENPQVKPIGLGARDMLRLEMGYSLSGQDIDEGHTPIEANLKKFVYMDKDFIGKNSLNNQLSDGIKNTLVGFVTDGRRSPRHNFKVKVDNVNIGVVTSASFSPCLKKAIGLCYINTNTAEVGKRIILSDDKVNIDATITAPPFIQK